ncbi:hypothetical protein TKK_0000833 [Trichogramma kaykai]
MSTSDEIYGASFRAEDTSEGDKIGDDKRLGDLNQEKLAKLKSEKANWKIEKDEGKFYRRIRPLIENWIIELADLREIFQKEEIECLLSDHRSERFVKFVARSGYKDEPELDENGKPPLNRTTPVHRISRGWHYDQTAVIRELFKIYNKYDVNYIDEFGFTHFHAACEHGCVDIVEKFLDFGQDPNLSVGSTTEGKEEEEEEEEEEGIVEVEEVVYPPLHLALQNGHQEVVKLLLRSGADPNSYNAEGETPLHIVGMGYCKHDFVNALFEFGSDGYQPPKIDARDNEGDTPLHLAVRYGQLNATESLLLRDANPNSLNNDGETPLHLICKGDGMFLELFFQINHDLERTLRVDARDKLGNTALHYAIYSQKLEMAKLLLLNGANPNLANEEGTTPLHIVCHRRKDDGLVDKFFKMNEEANRAVQVDVRDKLGWTPLQLVVANPQPDLVDLLLDRGADPSTFVFPTESLIVEKLERWFSDSDVIRKFNLVSGLFACVERLERRGYELDRSGATTIMALFAKYELFENSEDFEKLWNDEEEFQLRITEAVKRLTYPIDFESTDYEKYRKSYELYQRHRCEITSRGFFRKWALYPLWEKVLMYRLPILCCDMIVQHLNNEDLHNICLAAEIQSHEDSDEKTMSNLTESNNKKQKTHEG